MAYYFHWQKKDIMELTIQERRIWLSQIHRIHTAQKKARDREMVEQAQYLIDIRNTESE